MSRRILPLAILLLLTNACAYTIDTVDIAYTPAAAAKPVPGAKSVTVALDVRDARTADRDRIAAKKNALGNDSGAIVASRTVPALVAEALQRELQARGFRVGPGPVTVRAGIERFHTNFTPGPAIGDSYGEVVLRIQVLGKDSAPFLAKKYEGISQTRGPVWLEYQNAKKSLEPAFAEAIQAVMADKAFLQAIAVANSAR